jgi:hypothetical protein
MMGFFSSLFGWDQSMGALNAVLASHLIENSSLATNKLIAKQVIEIMRSVNTNMSDEKVIADLNKANRVVQMNFIAIACDNLGIPPKVPNNVWTRIKNPYLIGQQVDESAIEASIDAIFRQDKCRITWPGNQKQINFNTLLQNGRLN